MHDHTAQDGEDDHGRNSGASKKETILTSTEGDDRRVQIAIYERHEAGEPGAVMRHELSLYEMQRLHEMLTDALWAHIRRM
jgi:hypothetical protein